MEKLSANIKQSFKSALKLMNIESRRAFAASLCEEYYGGSARKMERDLGCKRSMISTGLGERRTGIKCLTRHHECGRKKKKI